MRSKGHTTSVTSAAKSQRRWFQFSVRTLLIVTSLCAALFGLTARWSYLARQQRAAVVALEAAGAYVRYDFELEERRPTWPAWLARILGRDYFASVRLVSFKDRHFTDGDLDHLQPLAGLHELDLRGTNVSDADLLRLEHLTSLTILSLGHTRITDAGLRHLRGLSSLRKLSLNNTAISDTGLKHLKHLKYLDALLLHDTQVSDMGLKHLVGLTELKSLTLGNTKVTPPAKRAHQTALPRCKMDWEDL